MTVEKILKSAWDEFVYGGHLLSLGTSGIIYIIIVILGQKVNPLLLIIGYLIAQIICSNDHFQGTIANDHLTNPERARHILKFKKRVLIMLFTYCLFFFVISYYLKNIEFFILGSLMILSGILYTFFFKKLTQKILIFKNIYVSFVWAFLVILISKYYNTPLNLALYLLFLFIFFRLMLGTIFFDIKDIESDKIEKMKTLPVVAGKEKTIKYLHWVNALSFLPLIIGAAMNKLPPFTLSLLFFYLYSFYYLFKAGKDDIKIHFLSYVLVDAEYLLWAVMIYFVKLIVCPKFY